MAAFIIFAQIFFMYQQKLPIILASKSPRRQELMTAMNLDFKVVLKEVDETYPEELLPAEIAVYIAEKKQEHLMKTAKAALSLLQILLWPIMAKFWVNQKMHIMRQKC